MTCDKIRAQLTAYLDGELADDRGSVVRGHLRGCAPCRQVASDEAALRDGLRALPPVDPPVSLWAGVQARLAAEEVADAQRPAWRRVLARWMPRAPQLALGGALAAAVSVLLVVRAQRDEGGGGDTPAPGVSSATKIDPVVFAAEHTGSAAAATQAPDADPRDVTDAVASAPGQVTQDYAAAADELLPLAHEARARWSADEQRAFDRHVAELQQAVTAAPTERLRQRGYRALIRYLQRAAVRDEVVLASIGGAR